MSKFKIFSFRLSKYLILALLILFMPAIFSACKSQNSEPKNSSKPATSQPTAAPSNINHETTTKSLINTNGKTVAERIEVPDGFERVKVEPGSYQEYLRNLPLRPHGSKIKLYNGQTLDKDVHVAVLDIDVGDRDLQQCADAVMRLRAEYLYGKEMYDRIHFNFTDGFKADYATWMNGNRIAVKGDNAYWVKKTGYSKDYKSFRNYLDMVFAYAGTLSLSQEMKKVPIEDMQIGDVFIKGDDPGHTVDILDMAENKKTGEKIFIISQSYMPAQDIHILKNYENESLSPWYPVNFGDKLNTPQWVFKKDQLMRFRN